MVTLPISTLSASTHLYAYPSGGLFHPPTHVMAANSTSIAQTWRVKESLDPNLRVRHASSATCSTQHDALHLSALFSQSLEVGRLCLQTLKAFFTDSMRWSCSTSYSHVLAHLSAAFLASCRRNSRCSPGVFMSTPTLRHKCCPDVDPSSWRTSSCSSAPSPGSSSPPPPPSPRSSPSSPGRPPAPWPDPPRRRSSRSGGA